MTQTTLERNKTGNTISLATPENLQAPAALLPLLKRVEANVGADRGLDRAIMYEVLRVPAKFQSANDDPRNYTGSLEAALTLLPAGFWWRGGMCGVSSEMIVCPDHNRPAHRERLLRACPPTLEHWNSGIEVTLWPGSHDALIRATLSACLRAQAALLPHGEAESRDS